jgi:hypothetical protein
MCEPFLCPKVVISSIRFFQDKNKGHGYIKGHIRTVFKSTPRQTRNIEFCYNKVGIITEDIPISQDKEHIGI